MLVDHPDPVPGQAQLPAAQPRHLQATDTDRACIRALQHVDAAQQGALAGAGLPENPEDLPLANPQINPVDGGDRPLPGAVRLPKTAYFNHVNTLVSSCDERRNAYRFSGHLRQGPR
ncbi:hypothetical protein Aph02nite_02660 [Actinoplanes philippinensis]|nr:hypothetical protein Aph02nite_02660 [Actinoplanes philippinensis]